jgi:apolipoprotein N-acyltransferase
MAGLTAERWSELRDRQVSLAESAFESNVHKLVDAETKNSGSESLAEDRKVFNDLWNEKYKNQPKLVILPESPMNYQWEEDPEFQKFISAFAATNNVNVLFNSDEPDKPNHKYFNSAVMIDASGREVAEYDKIYLLPFGEAVPTPLENILPGFVGNFSYGRNYSLVPLGDAKAGIMICFESHFGQLSREYVRRGADAIIEMTNDGYLGPTPVLRQHLANAVFRAIETNRPVLRVTNVGITAYINERGEVLDATQPYTEDTRVWSVARSDGSQTFYVKYGDWFAWLSLIVTAMMLFFSLIRRNSTE